MTWHRTKCQQSIEDFTAVQHKRTEKGGHVFAIIFRDTVRALCLLTASYDSIRADAVVFYLLGLSQHSYNFGIEVCYSVHVASVGSVIPV